MDDQDERVTPLHGHQRGAEDQAQTEEGTILPRDGTCLITAGVAGSGKSVLQRALIHKLFTDESVRLEFRDGEGEALQDPELQQWIFEYDRGEFPDRNVWRGKIQTFFIEFGQGRKLVALSFAEIAGEAFQGILPGEDRPAQGLGRDIEHILTTPDVKKLFVFVADSTRDGTDGGGDEEQALYQDMMFAELLSQIRGMGLRRVRILFVASKWDRRKRMNMTPKRFFERRLPQTRSKLKRFPGAQVQYVRFSVGNVREGEGKGGRGRITHHDEQYAARVVNWIHQETKGRPLKGYPKVRPTLWDRIKGWSAR